MSNEPPIYTTLKRWLDRAQHKSTNTGHWTDSRPEGYTYVEIPEWELRQALELVEFNPEKVLDKVWEAHQKRSWAEDFSHENGNYTCLCCECGLTFMGHKRRVACKVCTQEKADLARTPDSSLLETLRTYMEQHDELTASVQDGIISIVSNHPSPDSCTCRVMNAGCPKHGKGSDISVVAIMDALEPHMTVCLPTGGVATPTAKQLRSAARKVAELFATREPVMSERDNAVQVYWRSVGCIEGWNAAIGCKPQEFISDMVAQRDDAKAILDATGVTYVS